MDNTKTCTKCSKTKTITEYHEFRSPTGKMYRKSHCRDCANKLHAAWKSTPRGRAKRLLSKRKSKTRYQDKHQEMKKRLMALIEQESCLKCGCAEIAALCFHHRHPTEKEFSIVYGMAHCYPFERLLPEAKKCDVLCANCHTIEHSNSPAARAGMWLKLKRMLMLYIGQEQCLKCRCADPRCLSFHHRDENTKRFKIADSVKSRWTLEETLEEVKKCDVLCMNCHFIHHATQSDRSLGPSARLDRDEPSPRDP